MTVQHPKDPRYSHVYGGRQNGRTMGQKQWNAIYEQCRSLGLIPADFENLPPRKIRFSRFRKILFQLLEKQ